MVQTGNVRARQTIRFPSGTLGSGRIVDARATDGSRGQGHTERHLSVGGGGKSPLRVPGGAIETTVHHEEGTVGKVDKLTHGAGLEHVIILLPNRAGSVEWFRGDALAVLGSGNQPGVDKGPGVVTPAVFGHVATAAEEESGVIVVRRGQGEHGDTSGGRVDSDDVAWNVGEADLLECVGVPKHGGNVGLDEHLSGGHHEGVSVRVEARGIDHELHDLGVALGWEELDGGLGGTSLGSGIGVWVVPVDVATVDEAANQSNGTIGKGLSGRVPTRLLHLQHVRIFVPLAFGSRNEIRIRAGARIDDTDGPGTVVILVGIVVLR